MILTLFGTVSGFQSLVFGKPPTGLIDGWIDYRNELPLNACDWAVVVRRRQVTEGVATWIGLYRHANEMGASRGGVYGAGAWLINQWVPGDLIMRLLWAHADEMARIGVEAGQFTRTLDEIEHHFQWPQTLGAEVMNAVQPWERGGLGVGDKPTALLDLSGEDASSGWGWALAALQCGPGVDGFDRAIVTSTAKVVVRVMAGAMVTPLTPPRLMQLGANAVADAQQQAKAEHQRLLHMEQERTTLRETIQHEIQQRLELKVAQQAAQRESAQALELLEKKNRILHQSLMAAQSEVDQLKLNLQKEGEERVAAARNRTTAPLPAMPTAAPAAPKLNALNMTELIEQFEEQLHALQWASPMHANCTATLTQMKLAGAKPKTLALYEQRLMEAQAAPRDVAVVNHPVAQPDRDEPSCSLPGWVENLQRRFRKGSNRTGG